MNHPLGEKVRHILPLAALTGAGISAESGVPTFRGAGGMWQSHRAQDLANPAVFARDAELVWRFYHWRREFLATCKPNQAHYTLAEMERDLGKVAIITQNVDGLHQAAGSTQVIELHGSIWRLRCTACNHTWVDLRVPLPKPIPRCPVCDQPARPDVVWFGEMLDPIVLQRAHQITAQSRTMLIVGTSAVVQPAAQLPAVARQQGAKLIEINPEETPVSGLMDEVLRQPAAVALPRWWAQLRR